MFSSRRDGEADVAEFGNVLGKRQTDSVPGPEVLCVAAPEEEVKNLVLFMLWYAWSFVLYQKYELPFFR